MEVTVATCFSLGQSLRCEDAEAFLEQYDKLIEALDQQTAGMILTTAKEFARQISELPKDDYSMLESAFDQSSSHTGNAISADEPVVVQLMTVLEELMCEDDSGAVSDMESSTAATELFSDASSTHLLVSECEQSMNGKDHMDKLSAQDDVTSAVNTGESEGAVVSELSTPSADTVSMPNGSTNATESNEDSLAIESKNSISGSGSFTKVRRRVKQHRALSSDGHTYNGPADLYQKKAERKKPAAARGGHRRQRAQYNKGQYTSKGYTKAQSSTPRADKGIQRGVGWRKSTGKTTQQPSAEYNYYQVANFLLKGWQRYKKELLNTQ